jgi:hypothetical protein
VLFEKKDVTEVEELWRNEFGTPPPRVVTICRFA